jgi:hypothetical protein
MNHVNLYVKFSLDSPPPNAYKINSNFSTEPRSKAFTFGLCREVFKKVYLKENPVIDLSVPGPGTYKTNEITGNEGSKWTLRPKTRIFFISIIIYPCSGFLCKFRGGL